MFNAGVGEEWKMDVEGKRVSGVRGADQAPYLIYTCQPLDTPGTSGARFTTGRVLSVSHDGSHIDSVA